MKRRLAMLIPEFPGQTHAFFWREIGELRKRGAEVGLFSTRRPDASIVCHGWSQEAIAETRYLSPMRASDAVRALFRLARAGLARSAACVRIVAGATELSWLDRLQLLPMILVAALLGDDAERGGWGHLHVHSCGWSALIARFANELCGLPYSLTLHGPLLRTYGPMQRQKWEKATFGIAVTLTLQEELLRVVRSFRIEQLPVAPMGVDAGKFRRSEPLVLPPPDGTWRLVSCGRLSLVKGFHHLLDAVAELRRGGMRIELAILGEGAQRANLEKQILELGLADSVKLLGAVQEEEVRRWLDRSHLFVLPSLEEAIGVATMEAMSMGLPVVVTGVGGVAELVRDRVDGFLIQPGSSAEVVQACRAVFADPARAARMGESGSRRVAESFGTDRSARLMLELMERFRAGEGGP